MLTILIVDDDLDQRETLAEALSDRHEVVTVGGANAAVAMLAAAPNRFNLVLTDLRMPGGSGIELKRALREQGQQVPLVLVSSDHHVSKLAIDEGFYDCLSKPLSFDLLDAIIARVAADQARPVSADTLLPVTGPDAAVQAAASDDGDPEA